MKSTPNYADMALKDEYVYRCRWCKRGELTRLEHENGKIHEYCRGYVAQVRANRKEMLPWWVSLDYLTDVWRKRKKAGPIELPVPAKAG